MAKRNLKTLRGKAQKALEGAYEKFDDVKEKGRGIIQDKPFTSIAVAAVAGAIVALAVNSLLGARKKSFREKLRDYI